ncbi:MAG: hypothetical protein HUU06_06310 [Planctomycetaceae bacterium]|nr:hypothetical protein [Planctomycetaceae bacterium]
MTHTLNLVDGSFGARIEGTVFRETKAHLDFSNYADDALTVALDEDDRGMILDLGHWADIAREREVDEADGGGIVFSSLSVDGADVRIARRHPKDSFQNLLAGRPILSTLGGEHRASIRPALGHVYLVRVEHLHKRAPTVFAKILVVAHRPGESIVLRWEPLPGA